MASPLFSSARVLGVALAAAALVLSPLVLGAPASADSLTGTIPTGVSPGGIAMSPDGATLYVTEQVGRSVKVIDVASGLVTGSIAVGSWPAGVAFAPDGTRAYVANSLDATVSVINVASGLEIAVYPTGADPRQVAVSPDSKTVVVGNYQGGSVTVLDAGLGVTHTVVVGAFPWGVAIAADGSRAFSSNNGSGSVSVIDLASLTVVGTIPVANPFDLVASPDGGSVYVGAMGSASIEVIDAAAGVLSSSIAMGFGPYYVNITPDGAKLLVLFNGGANAGLYTVDLASSTVGPAIAVGVSATDLTAAPDSRTAYVASGTDVYVVDLDIVPTLAPALSAPSGALGTPYSFATARRGSPAPVFALTAGALPPGVTLNTATGLVSGTPTAVGTSAFSITATSAAGSATVSYSVVVVAALAATGVVALPALALGLDLLVAGGLLLLLRRRLALH